MAIDEQKFGELIGTVGALITSVADMKAAIIPALKDARAETARYREETNKRLDDHEDKDDVMHAAMADVVDWMRGDGTPDDIGAKKTLNNVVGYQKKQGWIAAGISMTIGLIITTAGVVVEAFKK